MNNTISGNAGASLLSASPFFDEANGLLKTCVLPGGRVVHICSLKALKLLLKRGDQPFDVAVASSSSRMDDFFVQIPELLFLTYQDIVRDTPFAFNEGLALDVRDFLEAWPDAHELLFCCEGGMSRSPALTAAYLRHEGFDDGCVWDDPAFSPNTLVYRTMLKAWGIDVSEEECEALKSRSDLALERAIDAARGTR